MIERSGELPDDVDELKAKAKEISDPQISCAITSTEQPLQRHRAEALFADLLLLYGARA